MQCCITRMVRRWVAQSLENLWREAGAKNHNAKKLHLQFGYIFVLDTMDWPYSGIVRFGLSIGMESGDLE